MKLKWMLLSVIVVLWILGTIGIAIQIHQTPPPTGSTVLLETLKTVLLLLGGLGVILPTYLNIWQSIENNQNIQQRLEFDRLNNSFELIRQWDNPALFTARKFSREIKDHRSDISDNELIKRVEENSELKQSVIMIFNYFDTVRMSVFCGRVDERIVRSSLEEVFLDIYQRFLPWIKAQSSSYQSDLKELQNRWRT